ncbi:hypothetical protein DYB26_012406, partial [Aphanomyces astaci]
MFYEWKFVLEKLTDHFVSVSGRNMALNPSEQEVSTSFETARGLFDQFSGETSAKRVRRVGQLKITTLVRLLRQLEPSKTPRDKFEKVNFFFENILATAHEPVDTRIVAHFLSDPTTDGGQWDMIVNIINKYGACPKNVYGESFQTVDSERLNYLLGAKLRDFAKQLRDLHAAGATPADLQAAKVPMLQVCHRILSIHLGTPPTTFDFEVHDKDEKHVRVPHLTPRKFVTSVVPIDVNDYVSLVNDPRNALDSILTSN